MKKQIFILTLLLIATQQVFVTKTDNCDSCAQFKSQIDCLGYLAASCTWTEKTGITTGSCAATIDPYVQFCSTVETPATNCAKVRGCAYDSGKCVPFAGCSAYTKTNNADCQATSKLCIFDGKQQCTDAQECTNYSQEECESTPSLYSPFKCKLDGTTCRSYKCTEADATLTTTAACDSWLSGCKTTGQGCIDVVPACSSYSGTATTCPLMKGTDGICDFDSTNNVCKARDCANAPATTATDADCGIYKSGCVTTGKGCISARSGCSSYSGNATTCLGYIGSDGDCTGDTTGTQCRAKKCEDKTATNNTDCNIWKSGCITNGKGCVSTLSGCSSYQGTTSTCLGYIGTDGNCKGTSATTAGSCAPKDCTIDAKGTETTNPQCQSIQSFCLTTGKGCAKTLGLCSTYSYTDDGTSCLSLVGSDGKCKVGSGGKCAVKLCSDAPNTTTSNTACDTFQTGCVTTGAGCVTQQICSEISLQQTCEGSKINNCGWNGICSVSTSCGDFKTKSICNGYKINNKPCIWDSTQSTSCRAALCTDFKGATDSSCQVQLTGCVSNGTDCLDGTDCSKFQGIQATCQAFKAKCTNLTSVTDPTTPCIARTCDDSYLSFDNDTDCGNYLSTCVTKGSGCIDKSKQCSDYSGTADQCNKFKGNNGEDICWNTTNSAGSCVVKACIQATGMTDNAGCGSFLTGCLYDGNGSCLDKSALCTAYTGDATSCLAFTGNDGDDNCQEGSGGKCKAKTCGDNTTATTNSDCGSFLAGCVTKGIGCVSSSLACNSYQGTYTQCNAFTGNTKQCTRLEKCASVVCANKTDATDNAACLSYYSGCRLQQGTTKCMQAPVDCTDFNNFSSGATNAQKLAYCNSIKNLNGYFCGFDTTAASGCADRTCNLWDKTLTGIACVDYLGTASCKLDGDGNCYAPDICSNYEIPTGKTNSEKLTYCSNLTDNSKTGVKCTYSPGVSTTKCSTPNPCEQIVSPTSAADCNLQLKGGNCQFYNGKCYTTQKSCGSYIVPSSGQQAYCAALKQNSNGVVVECAFDIGTSCASTVSIPAKCEDIEDANAQNDCDVISGCKYYDEKCYTRVECANYDVTDITDVLLFCQNMYDNDTNNYCSTDLASGQTTATGCTAPKAKCLDYKGLSTAQADYQNNITFCKSVRDKTGSTCIYPVTATACQSPADTAEKCSILDASMTNEHECDLRTLPFCKSDGTKCIAVTSCADHSVQSHPNKLGSCQSKTDTAGKYCGYSTGDVCTTGQTACTGFASLPGTDKAAYCAARIDDTGAKCGWVSGTTCIAASTITCAMAVSPQSQTDCDSVLKGCRYNYQLKICETKPTNCNTLTATGTTQAQKVANCGQFSNSSNEQCTYLTGTNCINKVACDGYDISTITDKLDKISACQAADTSDAEGCTYFGSGNACIKVGACTSYTSGDSTTCGLLETTDTKCVAATGSNAATACDTYATCEDVVNPTSIADCHLYFQLCFFYQNKCITPKSDCKYTYSGTSAKQYCSQLKNANGDLCIAASDTSTTCQNRSCDDQDAALFMTHSDCKAYLYGCKSNGNGCILASSTTCAQQSGNPGFCAWALDSDNQSTCVAATSESGACEDFDCSQNVYSTTDADCIAFNPNCLTKGNGCIAKTEPCTSYSGKQSDCAKFTGNGKKCWGNSTNSIADCKDKVCSDKPTATNQADCDNFLSGCIYSGVGCVDSSAPCTSYKGTQTDCSLFMGVNKTQYCWGASPTSVGQCTIRQCSDKKGTSDAECGSFMPPISPSKIPKCITDGSKCVDYGKACSFFSGNDETCSKFTSIEGTCKASTYTTTSVACAPRVCYEAPNSYATDAQCDSYQKGCKTTGRGCIASPSCNDVQTQSICSAKAGCQWTSQCRALPTLCSSLTSSGQAICTNTPLQNGKNCAWYNGTCRDFTCADYDASLVQHGDCQKKDSTCTTSGAGCVTIGSCSSYHSRTICEAANSTDVSIRCTWNAATNSCRQRICTDGNLTTDTDCSTFLSGCISTDASCIGPTFTCSAFTGFPKKCLQNSSGQPCIRVNDVCYDFDDCTDAPFSDFNTCQKFSPLCVPNTTNCRAMTFCEKYDNQIQCTSGISSTGTASCGWQPPGKCATYTKCSDAEGTSLMDCVNWNTKCVSDGAKCVDKGTCSTYGNETACGNVGTDGLCKWTGSACRLRECSDNIAATDTDCAAYTVATGVCTTDGTKCVLRAACSSYTEQGCYYGQDGIPCVFDFPVGTTTGTKSCRPKECADVKGTTNDQCVGQIPNKKCVSDGTTCVKQDTCANYKNQTSCKAGGSDDACAFSAAPTATNANAGTCVLFNSCAAANKDQVACSSKPKQCKWTSTTSGTTTTTTCTALDCASAASGTNCVAVPNFDSSSFTICVLTNGVCTAGDPSTITQDNCYKTTQYSYTWNESTNKCVFCKGTSVNNSTGGNIINNTNVTTDSGYILGVTFYLSLLGLFA